MMRRVHRYLKTLDASKCPTLESLHCEDNGLITLDVSECLNLVWVYCKGNDLTTIDVTKCTKLRVLNCEDNGITTLDVTKCKDRGCTFALFMIKLNLCVKLRRVYV